MSLTPFVALLVLYLFFYFAESLNNGLARSPPMGWDTYNHFHGDYTDQLLIQMTDLLISTGMNTSGYHHVSVDGGWAWALEVNGTYYTQRNETGFILPDPTKFPDGIEKVINYIHSKNMKWGHYTNAGVNQCGGAHNASEYWMDQDISLFAEWKIDMVKVDNCDVVGNDTQIIFKWRDMLNATGRPILFSNCRNGCQNDAEHKRVDWQPYCVNLSNSWRISTDINPGWGSVMHNFHCGLTFGKWAQPGAWTDLDLLEVDNENFKVSGYNPKNETERYQRILMNQAHFTLWCILSAPLMATNDLRNMDDVILDILTDKYAIAVNQNYLDNAGDVITEFNISDAFRQEYQQETMRNSNYTQLLYKPMIPEIGNASIVFLNHNDTNFYSMQLSFKDLPFANSGNDNQVQCNVYDIWNKTNATMTQYNSTLWPMSVKFLILSDCKGISTDFVVFLT